MKYGMNLLLWATAVDESHDPVLEQLRDIGYDGYVSIEQRMIDEADPLAGICQSAHHLKE